MKLTLSTHQAANLLTQDKDANWSYNGAVALVEYLEELEKDAGVEWELDAVALRCDYSEFKSLEDWADDYGFSSWDNDEQIRDFINDHGQLIEFEGGIIVSSFKN